MKFEEAQSAMRAAAQQADLAIGEIGRHLTQAIEQSVNSGFMALVSNLKQRARGEIGEMLGPFGSAIALFLELGVDFQTKWNAIGNQVAQNFERIGDVTHDQAVRMGANLELLYSKFGMSQGEFDQQIRGITAAGIDIGRAMAPMGDDITGMQQNMIGTMALLDRAFETGSGRIAEIAGQAARLTNEGMEHAISDIARLGIAVRGTGTDFGALLGTISQVNQSLRLQGDDIGQLGSLYMHAQEAAMAFARGPDRAAVAGQLGQDVLGGFGAAVGRLGPGWQAAIGESALRHAGADTGGMDRADIAMRFATNTLGEMGGGAPRAVESPLLATLRFLQERLADVGPGRGAIGLQGMGFAPDLRTAAALEELLRTNKDLSQVVEQLPPNVREAIGQRIGFDKEKQDPMERLGRELKEAVSALAASLVMTILSFGQAVAGGIQYLGAKLTGDPNADAKFKLFSAKIEAQQQRSVEFLNRATKVGLPTEVTDMARGFAFPSNEDLAASGAQVAPDSRDFGSYRGGSPNEAATGVSNVSAMWERWFSEKVAVDTSAIMSAMPGMTISVTPNTTMSEPEPRGH